MSFEDGKYEILRVIHDDPAPHFEWKRLDKDAQIFFMGEIGNEGLMNIIKLDSGSTPIYPEKPGDLYGVLYNLTNAEQYTSQVKNIELRIRERREQPISRDEADEIRVRVDAIRRLLPLRIMFRLSTTNPIVRISIGIQDTHATSSFRQTVEISPTLIALYHYKKSPYETPEIKIPEIEVHKGICFLQTHMKGTEPGYIQILIENYHLPEYAGSRIEINQRIYNVQSGVFNPQPQ